MGPVCLRGVCRDREERLRRARNVGYGKDSDLVLLRSPLLYKLRSSSHLISVTSILSLNRLLLATK